MDSSGARHFTLWREGKFSLPMPREEDEEQVGHGVSELFWPHSEFQATGCIGPQDDSCECHTPETINSISFPICDSRGPRTGGLSSASLPIKQGIESTPRLCALTLAASQVRTGLISGRIPIMFDPIQREPLALGNCLSV